MQPTRLRPRAAASGRGTSPLVRGVLGLALVTAASTVAVGLGTDAAFAGNSDFRVVFEANTGNLAGYSSGGSNFSTTLGMLSTASPTLAELSDGTYQAAFQANTGRLAFSHLGGGTLTTNYGMDPGTSPAIAALPSGGWISAFQTNNHYLYLYSSKNVLTKTTLGMQAGTNPAIAVRADGSFKVVFQDNVGVLAGYNSTGTSFTTTVGMNPAGSPSLAAKPDGTYEAAVEANTNALTTVHIGTGYTVNGTTLGMAPATDPAVAVQSDGSFKVMFAANTNVLYGYNSTGSNFSTGVGMKAGTSPSFAPLTDGTYEAAVEANTDRLATVHIGTGVSVNTTHLGMEDQTSPAIGIPSASAPPTQAAKIAALAMANVGKTAGSCAQPPTTNSLGESSFYTSCSGGVAEFWCADFAKWVWNGVGIDVTGLTAAAGSFVAAAPQNGSTVHTASSYLPQVGDAVVYNYGYQGPGTAEHVGLVTAVNSDGSLTTVNGDWGGSSAYTSTVQTVAVSASQKYVGDTPSGIAQTISAYVTPSGLS